MFLPTDIANEALDAIGADVTLGDIEDGTREAQVCARKYRPCLASLLKAAHWSFARKQTPMQMLADATGQFVANRNALNPWIYEYALPNDCVQPIYVPWQMSPMAMGGASGNITPPGSSLPLMGGLNQANLGYARPARFLISRDANFPPDPGQGYTYVQGQSPMGRTVVLTNVPSAFLVYTSLVLTPSEWDTQFRESFVAYFASEIALAIHRDKKFGMAMRKDQTAIAMIKISEARARSANENWNVNSSFPDWIRARNSASGAGFWGWGQEYGLEGGGTGILGMGWDSINLGGAAF